MYGAIGEGKTYRWDLTPEFVKDVERIWSVRRGNVRLWNAQIGVFEAAEEVGLTTTAAIPAVDSYLSRRKASYKIINGIVG